MTFLQLLILSLATFRVALLLSEDDGPFGVNRKLRHWLSRKSRTSAAVRKSEVAKGIRCVRCNGWWVALLLAGYASTHDNLSWWMTVAGDFLILSAALSAAAILINRIPEKN